MFDRIINIKLQYFKSFDCEQTSSSSSCHAINMDIPDLFSPLLPIVHCFWQVFRATSRIGIELLYVGSSWSSYLCSTMWRGPQEYITHELVPTSPEVSCMSGSLWALTRLKTKLSTNDLLTNHIYIYCIEKTERKIYINGGEKIPYQIFILIHWRILRGYLRYEITKILGKHFLVIFRVGIMNLKEFEGIQKNIQKIFEKDYVMKREILNKLRVGGIASIQSRFV